MISLAKCIALVAVIAGAWYFYLRDQEMTWMVIQLGAMWLMTREIRLFLADRRNRPPRYRDDPHEFEDIPELRDSRNSSHKPVNSP